MEPDPMRHGAQAALEVVAPAKTPHELPGPSLAHSAPTPLLYLSWDLSEL